MSPLLSPLVRGSLVVAGCVALLGACGLGSQPDTDGVRVNDGVAPFADQGGLQICIGTSRLQSSVPREGLCRADAQVPSECASDAECESPESCVCGLCMVQFCEASSECREGLVCAGRPKRCIPRCDSDEECGPFGVCNGGACETACWDQSDCPTGELCLVGRCAAVGCGPEGPNCFEGETCLLQATQGTVTSLAALPAGDVSGVAEESRVVLFVELATADEPSALVRFESVEGRRFVAVPGESILPPAGATRISNPSALRTPEGLRFFVELDNGAAIATALDSAGTGLTLGAFDTLLTPGGWASEVHAPSAALVDGQVVVAYAGAVDEGIAVQVMAGDTLAPSAAPTLTPAAFVSPGRFEGVTTLGGPHLVAERTAAGRTLLRLYADATGTALPVGEEGGSLDLPTSSVVYAAAIVDGVPVPNMSFAFVTAEDNPTFGRVQNFAPLEEFAPSLVRVGQTYLLNHAPAILRGVDKKYLKAIEKLQAQANANTLGIFTAGSQVLGRPVPLLLRGGLASKILVRLVDASHQHICADQARIIDAFFQILDCRAAYFCIR